jgi:hypothetical protein
MEICVRFLRAHNRLDRTGVFRVAGDEGDFILAKHRLQHVHTNSGRDKGISVAEDNSHILIGNTYSHTIKFLWFLFNNTNLLY